MEKNCITQYVTDHGEVKLSPEIIKSYLVPPDSKITDSEIGFFLQMCKFQKLNPFMKEIYIVKFGNYPAAFIVAKDTFLRRAKKNETYRGHAVGISDDGKQAWAEVYIENFDKPIRCDVEYDEYVVLKDGSANKMWAAKPKTMLKKVALVQALREAFPQDLGGLYDKDEMGEPDEVIKEANAIVQEAGTKSASKKTDKKSSKKEPEKKSSESPSADTSKSGDSKTSTTTGEALEIMSKIKNITQTTGGDPAKPWTRYNIESAGGSMYTTFDKKFADAANTIKGKDEEALLIYVVVNKSGVDYFNLVDKVGFSLI